MIAGDNATAKFIKQVGIFSGQFKTVTPQQSIQHAMQVVIA
jgi:hypothetical protein